MGKHQNEQFRKRNLLQEFPSIIWRGNQQFGSLKSSQTPYILIPAEKPQVQHQLRLLLTY